MESGSLGVAEVAVEDEIGVPDSCVGRAGGRCPVQEFGDGTEFESALGEWKRYGSFYFPFY